MSDILSLLAHAVVVDEWGDEIAPVFGFSIAAGKMIITIDLEEGEEEDDDDPESVVPEDGFNKIVAISG